MKLTIGIIGGKGKMGKAFARFFEELGYKVLISDLKTKLTNTQLVKKADVIIVSVPIDKTETVIKKVVQHLKPQQLIMDLTSVKEMPVREMAKGKASVIGLHPMCNDTTFGPGQKMLVCPKKPGKWLKWVEDTFKNKGGLILHKLTAKKHDELMSVIQGLVHFAEFTFGKALKERGVEVNDLLPFASPAAGLKTEIAARILSHDPKLYGGIQINNERIPEIIETFIASAKELQEVVKNKDLKGFCKYFNEPSQFRGDYTYQPQKQRDWIIIQWLEKFNKKPTIEQKKCSKRDIVVLGPENSYSYFAAEKLNKKLRLKKNICCLPKIEDVFNAVASKKAFAGIVPIENNLHGTVRETMDNLFKKNVQIRAEFKMPIHHCFATLNKDAKIKSIFYHPQALYQCSDYIKKHYKKAELEKKASTSAAFQYTKKLKLDDAAVIGPLKAAQNLGFHVLDKNIENDHRNTTTFILITHKNARFHTRNPQKVSIAFHFSEDSAGSLHGVLGDFKEAGINLTRLESRPAEHALGYYIFFLDFQGTLKKAEKTLSSIKKKVAKLKVLGEY